MKLNSKFNVGDEVYFLSLREVKAMKGKIINIGLYYSEINDLEWSYGIKPIEEHYPYTMSERIPEDLIFKDRSEILDFCMRLTEDI